MLKKRTRIIITIVIVGFVINAFMWGTCFEHMGGFEHAVAYPFKDFVTENHAYIYTRNNPKPTFGIPFVFWLYCLERPPYYLKITINDETRSLARMILESVHIDYGDGDTKKFELHWDKELVASKIHVTNASIPTMWLEEKLPAILEKNKSCTIKLIGFFIDSTGNKMPFETEDHFKYETTYWRVYTGGSF